MCAPTWADAAHQAARLRRLAGGDGTIERPGSTAGTTVDLEPVDAVEVTVLDDNVSDMLLADAPGVRRAPRPYDIFDREPLRAEHGYALLVTVERAGGRESILYDAGLGRDTVAHNLDVLGLRPQDFRAIALSHGHADHHGGLAGVIRQIGRRGLPLILHPDAWRDRKNVAPNGTEIHLPPPNRADLEREGAEIVEERGPSLLIDRSILVTGQIDRTTDFERGMPSQQARGDGGWEPDPWIWDDQAIVIDVRDRGLVVLSSCSHAGVINVLRHARRLTGVDRIAAFAGGLHLSGAAFETIIPPTVDELAAIGPAVVVPGHCSGWRAIHAIAQRLPDAFVPGSVGTTFRFGVPAA